MSRSGLRIFEVSIGVVLLLAGFAGCGSNHAVNITNFAVPASITITPTPNLSMELGTNQAFSASPLTSARTPINEPVSFQSSNTAVVTVAANGLACAGSWDSLSTPQICTPGPSGIALITATAQGVSSPTTTVYVHQHIDKVVIKEIPPPPPLPPPPPGCRSVGQVRYYAASAYSHGADITSTAGVFTWQSLFSNVANLSTTATGLLPGQLQATAAVPGLTSLFASVGNTNSPPMDFLTCQVQSIALTVTSKTATSETIMPTVIDSLGTTIPSGSFLTWSSSEPGSVSVSSTGAASAVTTGGGATIIASCTPPLCNTGFYPSLPIYPENVETVITPGNGTTGTVFASSTGCGISEGCISNIVPITAPANTLGTFQSLPATPNSLVLDRLGAKAYLGTNSGLLGSVGLAILNTGGGGSQFKGAPGKVLAVSPDGSKVIISDTSPSDGPNQVFVFDAASSTSVNFQITGATAADFSPDSLKAYIVAGNNLYIYSKLDALQTIPLTAPANDVSFLSQGAFPYLAGGAPSAVTVWSTCHSSAFFKTPIDTISVATLPNFIKTLPGPAQLVPGDATSTFHMLAVAPPSIDLISVNPPLSPAVWEGCTPVVVNQKPVQSFNLGRGNFVAKQLMLSQDGTTAYIVTSNPGSILVFNIPGQTSSAITLTGNAVPLSASLTPSGSQLYVGANDGTVHVVDTVVGGDIQQIAFPQTLCRDTAGLAFPVTCNPDLVAVKP
jgi:hypothetical protein